MVGDFLVNAETGEVGIDEGGRDGNGASVVGLRVNHYEPVTANVDDDWSIASPVGTEVQNLSVDWDSAGGSVRTYKLRRNYAVAYPHPQVMDDGTLTFTETTISAPPGVPITFNATIDTNDGSWFRQQHIYYWLRKARDFFDGQVFPSVSPTYSWGLNAISMDRGTFLYCAWGYQGATACYSDELKRIEFIDSSYSAPHGPRARAHEYGHHVVNLYGDQSQYCQYNVDEGWIVDEALAETFAFLVVGNTIGTAYGSSGFEVSRHTTSNPATAITRQTPAPTCGSDPYTPSEFWRQAILEVAHNYDCSPGTNCRVAVGHANRSTFGTDLGWTNSQQARNVTARAMAYAAKVLPMGTTMPAVALYTYTYIDVFHSPAVADDVWSVFLHHGAVP